MAKKDSILPVKKTALEVTQNGRRIAVAGLHGRKGAITTTVSSIKGEQTPEDLHMHIRAFDTEADEHLRWTHKSLKMGDEIKIRIIDSVKISPARDRHKPDRSKKNNIGWIRELAKKLGYKLVKIKRS